MKKNRRILFSLLGALTLGVGSLVSLTNKKANKPVQTDASTLTHFTGFYQKVESPDDINNGDHVFIVSDNGQIVRDLGGNPAFLYTTNEGIYRTNDGSFVALDNAYVTEFVVTKNTNTSPNRFAFYGDYYRFNKKFNGYLGYDYRGSSSAQPGGTDYSGDGVGIGYFYEGFGLRKTIVDQSSFTMTYDSVGGHMKIQSVSQGTYISWTNGYSSRLCLSNYPNVNIYKQTSIASVSLFQSPDKTNYKKGDKLDLSGLIVDIHVVGSSGCTIAYNDFPGLFIHDEYVVGYGNQNAVISIRGGGQYGSCTVPIHIDSNNGYYYRVNTPLYDPRGKYIFVLDLSYGEPDYRALSFRNNQSQAKSIDISNEGYINPNATNVIMDIILENNNYYMMYEDSYVSRNGSDVVLLDYASTALTFEFNNSLNCPVIKNGSDVFGDVGYQAFQFNSSASPVLVYKLEFAPSDQFGTFINKLRDLVSHCNGEGAVNFIEEYATEWSSMSTYYSALATEDKVYLHNITYKHGQEDEDSIKDLIDRYDYIVAKYNASDFMERTGSGSYQANFQRGTSISTLNNNLNNMSAVIVIISIASLGTLVGLVIIKKRKHS